ncbi:hypothetical protein ACF0H5_024582 [Mactra antiquata]
MADDAICIGPATANSYLHQNNLICAAINKDAQAIHPGVGFLAENASFAAAVRENDLIFIGAEADAIQKLGDKIDAKAIATSLKIPVTPGSDGAVSSAEEASRLAKEIGLPVMIKAAAGGGGRGIRIIRNTEELLGTMQLAAREAEAAFGDGTLFIEKFLEQPRHVEIQILADSHGNVIHLGERDCSSQLRHQKLVEESPSTELTAEMRESMGQDAVRLFRYLNYVGAGTVEFLVSQGHYYFMEVNARVQVEHPVTEMLTGIDIVQQQIKSCCGLPLDYRQQDVHLRGHALECRINALTPGVVTAFRPPLGPMTRVDTFLEQGAEISPFYDSLVAKIIVQAENRDACIARMQRALDELVIEGIKTNTNMHQRLLASDMFRSGRFATDIYHQLQLDLE